VFNGQPRAPHAGADLRATTGTPIYAANRGRVVLAKELFYSGNAVFIDHGLGLYSTYLHLSEIKVAPRRDRRAGRADRVGRRDGSCHGSPPALGACVSSMRASIPSRF